MFTVERYSPLTNFDKISIQTRWVGISADFLESFDNILFLILVNFLFPSARRGHTRNLGKAGCGRTRGLILRPRIAALSCDRNWRSCTGSTLFQRQIRGGRTRRLLFLLNRATWRWSITCRISTAKICRFGYLGWDTL